MLKKNILLVVIGLELLLGAYAYFNYGSTVEGLQAVTRYSGRLSLALFSIIFLLLPQNEDRINNVLPNPFFVFALAHGIHLIELLCYVYWSGTELIPIRLAGGFLAYVIIFIMPFIHYRYKNAQYSAKSFSRFLNIYLYYVWFIFFMSYLPRVQGKLPNVGGNYWEFVVLLAWVCMLLGMKLSSLIIQPKSK